MKHNDAPITVIIPCLNAGATLGEAIESCLAQTAPPIEVLVIDDGSSDDSVAVAQLFDARVRVLRNPHHGPGGARRVGVEEARGEYIAFVDADDTIEPTKHELQLQAFAEHGPYTLVHTDAVSFWTDGSRPERVRGIGHDATGRCTRVVFERNPVCGASSMLRRDIILEMGNYRPELFGTEDYGMSLVASTICDFVYIPQPLYRMRKHETNITNRSSHMAVVHWLAQDWFRRRCPDAFEALPGESVRQFMTEPVLRAAIDAYWRRDARDYGRLLRLAATIAPQRDDIQRLWRRRLVPMWALKQWDRLHLRAATVSKQV